MSDSAPAANWQEWCNVGEIGRPCEHGVYSPHLVIEDRPTAITRHGQPFEPTYPDPQTDEEKRVWIAEARAYHDFGADRG